MTDFRTFKSGEILSDAERAKLSPADRKTYDLEQKIRGLMKLADNEGATEAERANATQAIAKLITRHQIDLALLRERETGKANGPVRIVKFEIRVSNRFGLGGARCTALHRAVVVPLGGYSVFRHHSAQSTKTDAVLEVFLPEDLVDFSKMLIASLMLQFETSMKVATVAHVRELRWQWVSKSEETKLVAQFRKGYLLAWGDTVGRRVALGRQEAREEAQRYTGKELAVLDTAALAKRTAEDGFKANGDKIRTARKLVVSETGKTAGRRDGRRAQLGINEVGGQRTALAG